MDFIESTPPPKRHNRLCQTVLETRKLAASSARLIGACGRDKVDGKERPAAPKLGRTNLPENRARTEAPKAEGLLDPSA